MSASLPPRHKRQLFEQHHILLILEQRAVQGRDRLADVAVLEHFERHIFVEQQLEPVDQLARRRLFLEPRHFAHLVEDIHRAADERLLDAGEVDLDDLGHRVAVGEFDIVEETAAQEGVGQFLFIVRGDDDDRAFFRGDRLVGLVDVERHAIEFLEQVVREFDVGLVDLVDQQHGQLGRSERLPQFALLDVIADVVDALFAELAVAQARDRIILVKPLLRLRRRFDVPGDQRRVEGLGDFLGQHRLAGAGLALHEQRTAEQRRGVDRDLEVVGGDIGAGAFEAHRLFPLT